MKGMTVFRVKAQDLAMHDTGVAVRDYDAEIDREGKPVSVSIQIPMDDGAVATFAALRWNYNPGRNLQAVHSRGCFYCVHADGVIVKQKVQQGNCMLVIE